MLRGSMCAGLAVIAILIVPATLRAIDPAKAPPIVDTASLSETAFLARLRKIEQSLRKNGSPPLFASQPAVIPLTDAPILFTTNAFLSEGVPYLGLTVHLFNPGERTQTLDPGTITLTADGKQVRFSDVPASVRGYVVEVTAGRHMAIEDALPATTIALAPGKVTSVPMFFAPVDSPGKVPALKLGLEPGGRAVELDLNRLHGALLEADITRMGPQGACAVVTVQGAIDGINAGELAERFRELEVAGVTRYVIAFAPRATTPSGTVLGWLNSMAVFGEIGDLYRGLPSLPTEVAELHLTGLPASIAHEVSTDSRARHHQEIEAAIMESLWAPYRRASRRTVLSELENGDPRGRAAAIVCGAQAFVESDLPRLSRWIDDPSRTLRQGAAHAIARLNSDQARKTLETAVREGSPRSAESALLAMLNARSALTVAAGVQAALGTTTMSQASLLRILIDSRHPAFTDRIREAARSGSKEARLLALPAIGQNRSSETVRIFAEAFASPDSEIRDAALTAASARLDQGDQRLRGLLIEEAIRRLRANPADQPGLDIAVRTRDPRFVPLLASRLSSGAASVPERAALVERLTSIGGSAAMEVLLRQFEALMPGEQKTVLTQLWHEDPDRALPLAERLITSTDHDLLRQCQQILVHDGSDRSARAIRDAIRLGGAAHRGSLMLALATLATPVAFDALTEFRDAGNSALRQDAEIAFQTYWRRSPAYEASETAMMMMDNQIPAAPADVREALKLLNAAQAIDPLLPDVYRGRGNAYLRLSEWKLAASNFQAAMELNPNDDIALSGAVIAEVMQGGDERALAWLEEARPIFADDPHTASNYAYNSACAYARALERQLKQPQSESRDELVKQYREIAIERLHQAIDAEFGQRGNELVLLEKDPDLASLHEDPRFAQAVERVKQKR